MKKKWKFNAGTVYAICALIWYALAVVDHFTDGGNSVIWMCIGSLFLSLSAIQSNKNKEANNESKETDIKDENTVEK